MTDKQKTNLHDAHNAMPDEHLRYLYKHAMSHTSVFDLQRFGHHRGKSGGKMFASIAGFLVGFSTPWLFGAKAFAAGVMGASLFGSIWSATHTQNVDTGSADVSRFDRAQETMSSDGQIPVVYGTRQVTGNQTFHQTNADANTLHKHVVLCEGGIEGVVSVMANDMIIPTGSQTGNTVFTLMNNKYPDARVRKHGSDFDLWAGDNHHHIHLCTKKEVENSHDTYWEYQVSVTSLISYINQLYAEGWQAFPCAATNSYPGDLWDVEGNVYMDVPYGKVFGNSNAFQQQNHVSVDSTHGFVNFCADTIRGGTNYSFHDGDTPSNYDTVGGYPAMAWLDMNFIVSNELNGNPSVSAVVMGKKVYDTRTKKTAYSTNPAMCLRDFMLSKRYGLGRWISADDLDEDSWNKAADYCDEEISFLDASGAIIKAKRFELNMVIDQKNNALDWLQEILANFQGYLTLSNGKFKLHIEQQTDIAYKFNDDNCSDLSVTPMSLSDTPNKYVVKIIDPRNNWTTVACNVEDYADQKERQKIITKEVNLNGTTSQYQALRLARFYRDQNLACPLTLSWKTGINGMHLEPGDVVTISYHGVFTELPVRITEIKQDDDGKFDITGRQYNDTIYGDALGGGVHWYNYTDITQTVEKRMPSNPTNIKAYTQYRRYEDGTTGYDVICSYELPQRYDVETGLVYYKTNHLSAAQIGKFNEGEVVDDVGLSREWIYAGDSPTKIVISNAKVGDIYEFRVQSRTTDGLVSSEASAPTTTIKVTAKETVPSQPYNLTYDFTKAFTFKWSDVPDSDVMYYEIRTDTNVGSPVGLLGKTQSTSIDVNLMERKGTVYVYSVNTLKKYSYPAKVIYNYPKPDAPSYIHFTEALRGVNILVAPFPSRVKSMRLYVEGSKVSKALDLDNASYTFYGEPDVYNFSASYVDLMGEGYTSVKYSYTIKPEMNPEWLKDEAISLNKVDKTIQSAVKDAQDAIPRLDSVDNNINTINTNISELRHTDTELSSTIVQNKKDADDADAALASQIEQTAESITTTVQANKKDTDNAISQVSQKADDVKVTIESNLNNTDPSKSAYKSITQLQTNINGVSSTVQNNKSAIDTEISQIKQNANSLSSTVQEYHTDANNKITGLSTKITQNADKITSVVTNLSNSDKAKKNYSAIAQLNNDISLKVAKNDVINQINISNESIRIDGKKVHVTGDTKFDNNVIVGGMIASHAITADKLSAGTMELTNSQGIKGGGATLDANGLTVRGSDGSYVVHGSNGMEFHDGNGNTFAMVGAMVMGTVKDGQWVKFTKPWKSAPNAIVTPISLQTAIPGYNSTNLYLDCRPQNVTVNGFQAVCRTVLKAGSGGIIPINKSANKDLSEESEKLFKDLTSFTYEISEIKVPDKATQLTITSSWTLKNIGYTETYEVHEDDRYEYYYGDAFVDMRIDVNGSTVKTKRLASSYGQKPSWSQDFDEHKSGDDSETITVKGGDTVKVYGVFSVQTGSRSGNEYGGFGGGSASYTLTNFSFNTTADAPLASGNAFFLCTDKHNSPYTISDSQ